MKKTPQMFATKFDITYQMLMNGDAGENDKEVMIPAGTKGRINANYGSRGHDYMKGMTVRFFPNEEYKLPSWNINPNWLEEVNG